MHMHIVLHSQQHIQTRLIAQGAIHIYYIQTHLLCRSLHYHCCLSQHLISSTSTATCTWWLWKGAVYDHSPISLTITDARYKVRDAFCSINIIYHVLAESSLLQMTDLRKLKNSQCLIFVGFYAEKRVEPQLCTDVLILVIH